MAQPTMRQRLRYWFDNTMSRGTPALIGWLAAISLVLVVIISSLIVVVDSSRATSMSEALKEIWKNSVSTFKLGAGEGNLGVVLFTILLALAGIFFASTLISLITSGVNRKIMELRKGRSVVLEKGHTVILGWSDQVYTVISELVQANSNQRKACIAILADKDRTEMEDLVRSKLGSTKTTRVVCRTGSPIDANDINIVNPQEARSIITLSPHCPAPDKQVIKTLLAVTNSPDRRLSPYHVVATVTDTRNHSAAQLAGGDETVVVDADDIAARLVVQTCRQSGLSVVYTDLLDFGGDEVYVVKEPALAGRTFGDALLAYDTSSVLGLQRTDGTVQLKPPMDTMITATDRIIAVSEDDDTVRLSQHQPVVIQQAIAPFREVEIMTEHALMLGWNRRAATIIRNLDSYVAPHSTLHVVAQGEGLKDTVNHLAEGFTNLSVSFTEGDTSDRETLEGLEVKKYDHVIVLCYDDMDCQEADSHTLVTLLHLRDMQAKAGERYSIVSEMLDDRNRRLAQITKADDFIVSDKLISLLMTQLSENRHLAAVFEDLFDPEGAELYLKPVDDYVRTGLEIDFYTVMEAARRRDEVAIGYRVAEHATEPPTFGVVLNPDKKNKVTFRPGDRVIVLAEE